MFFRHSRGIWRDFPQLSAGLLLVQGVNSLRGVPEAVAALWTSAKERLAGTSEGELPEIQAWRRAFSAMGLKPTQYRCAAESLLRRFRKEGSIPPLYPIIDLCNAVSLRFATPVAVFDPRKVTEFLEVRYAKGDEIYTPFSGPDEQPQAAEIIFADAAGRAHARRWSHRQSGYSAVSESTTTALLVAEALHQASRTDMPELVKTLSTYLAQAGAGVIRSLVLTEPGEFEFSGEG
jgi:DNA/RNA-binding domain of Phe-tRNA-synthetase-like protein